MDVPHDSLDACSPAESPGVASMASPSDPWSEFKEDATPPGQGDSGDGGVADLVPDIHVAESPKLKSAKELLDASDIESMASREDAEYGIPVEAEPSPYGFLSSGLGKGLDLALALRAKSSGFTSNRKKKVMLGAGCLLAVIVGIFLLGGNDDSSGDASNLRGGAPVKPGVTTTPPKHSNECEDDPTFVHSNLKTCATFVANVGRVNLHQGRCAQSTGISGKHGKEVLVKDFCRKSCGECGDSKWASMPEWHPPEPVPQPPAAPEPVVVPPAPETQPIPTEPEATPAQPETASVVDRTPAIPEPEPTPTVAAPPNPADSCIDDATFVHSNGKRCIDFVANVGRPTLHEGRCSQSTGRVDGSGKELFVKDFCIYSCGVCGDSKWAQKPEAPAAVVPAEPAVEPAVEATPVVEAPVAVEPVAEAAVAQTPAEEPAVSAPVAEPPAAPASPEPVIETPAINPPAATAASPPLPSAGCVDDPTFVDTDGKKCIDYIPLAAFPTFLQSLCGQPSGRMGGSGTELLVSDFCVKSCGACPEAPAGVEVPVPVEPASETVPETPAAPEEPESELLVAEETAVEELEAEPGEDSIEDWIQATFGSAGGVGQSP